jgi:Mg/Co/Ni transporter MgtE
MSEMRSQEPDRSPSSYSGVRVSKREIMKALLASMPPQVRAAVEALSKADAETRRQVLDSMDSEARQSLETILQHME